MKFLPSVNEALVQVCLPKGVGQNWTNTLCSCQVCSIHLFKHVWRTALARMGFLKFLPSVMESLVQVCLPRSTGQKGVIHVVPASCIQITFTSMSAEEHWSELNDTLIPFHV